MRIVLKNDVHGTWTSISTFGGVATTNELMWAKARLCEARKCRCGGLMGETQFFYGDALLKCDDDGYIVRFTRTQEDG